MKLFGTPQSFRNPANGEFPLLVPVYDTDTKQTTYMETAAALQEENRLRTEGNKERAKAAKQHRRDTEPEPVVTGDNAQVAAAAQAQGDLPGPPDPPPVGEHIVG